MNYRKTQNSAPQGIYPIASSRLFRSTFIVVLILLVPVIPFLIFGEQCEAWITDNILENALISDGGWLAAGAVIVTLAADILLPVPSSGVMTFAGGTLGAFSGTLASWLGLNASCAIGWMIGRYFGMPVAARFSSPDELAQMTARLDRLGPWMLVAFRAVPVLAEASVLVAGVYQMSLRKFWPAVLIANLGTAAVYSALGSFASAHGWFGLAFLISVIAPLALLVWLLVSARQTDGNANDRNTGN